MKSIFLRPTLQRLVTICACLASAWLTSGCADTAIAQAVTAQTNTATEPVYALYELRTYTTHDGKLEALHSRFRDHTIPLFEKHGIKNVAYWTPADKPNTLIYLLAHQNKAAAENSWKAFIADPVWREAYAASQADGPLVANIENVFMSQTDFSPSL